MFSLFSVREKTALGPGQYVYVFADESGLITEALAKEPK